MGGWGKKEGGPEEPLLTDKRAGQYRGDSEGETFSSDSGTGGRSEPPPARQGDTQGGLPD